MKIAFVYDFPYPWHMGGIEKINKIESEALAKSNEVHFFTMRWPGMEAEFTKNRVHYHSCYPTSQQEMYLHRRRSIRKAIMFALTNFRIFAKRFDLVIIDEFPYLHIPIIKLYQLFTGCKVIMRVAEVWDKDYWIKYAGFVFGTIGYHYSKCVVRFADSYIINSYDTRERFKTVFNMSLDKIDVFTPVLDTGLIKDVKRKAKRKKAKIIFAGRLIKEKKVDKWLYNFAELAKSMPKLEGMIIGGGPERDYLKKVIRMLKLEKKVKLIPPIEKTRGLYKEIAESSVMLNMSEREGLSIITLESLSLGIPVVLPHYSPIPDEVKSMCVVENEKDIPKTLKKIIDSKDPSKFIKNESNLAAFQTSGIDAFYKKLFRKLELAQCRT